MARASATMAELSALRIAPVAMARAIGLER
ncbi:hypothetical protein [Klebsiella pneumoniae]